MVDIETLGTKPGSVILSIGACRFDETGMGEERFYRSIDVFDSLMSGLVIDQATLGWWRMQPPESKGALQTTRPLRETLTEFARYLTKSGEGGDDEHYLLWAKGPDFDLVMIEAAYTQLGLKKPWSYRVARDVRTILALAPGAADRPPKRQPHHALGDALYQAQQVIEAAQQLGFPLSEMV